MLGDELDGIQLFVAWDYFKAGYLAAKNENSNKL
jgi:hypothetical protein